MTDHSQAEWEAAAAAVLRKARRLSDEDPDSAVWQKLGRTTLDGISVTPLGLPGGEVAAVRPTREGPWDIRSLIAHPNAKLANEEALVDLDGGVTSLWLAADESTDVAATLAGVLLDLAPVVLDAPTATGAVADAFLALPGNKHADSNLGIDPLGAMLRDLPLAVDEAVEELTSYARKAWQADVRAIVVDATATHDLGASDAQELGWAIAVGTAYLRWLTAADGGNFSVDEAAALIDFRLAATDEQFPTIAKFRALRTLWASVLTHSGATVVETRVHGTTSRPMLSKYDPYVNMLRGTVAAFAAGVGGADAVTVLPFDSANGRPEAFGRRIARNVNHLLIDESHVAAVADPAGGAFAVEQLTNDLAVKGWAEFQALEAEWQGGHDFTAFLGRIEDVKARRETDIAKRKRPLTGLTEFPNLAETLPERDADPLNDRVTRYGASFEALRDAPAQAHVFLATMGTVAQHTARATFASNLLAAGGIAVDVAGRTASVEDLTKAYAGQPVVMLAGSDDAYAEWGADAATALRDAGAKHVIIAGKPTDYADSSAAMGVDALAFLTNVRKELGA
ncbi:methylmalonyl-CoA mutase family protein [Nocardioides sp. Kera G14]|uniref:methylmalonyl-CoA mutase family protein n=1 Tax=Nocardioides sp. Kera G14 TaxID=2884264 RepID=UPI001D0FB0DF|nr:methylmalonyl-CoA mutase family protein [Nocardioides sp. Kera G14]UDY24400.1 methylmalonyl-CoA mutase family protein [Nocardioides sp. Kera G14]